MGARHGAKISDRQEARPPETQSGPLGQSHLPSEMRSLVVVVTLLAVVAVAHASAYYLPGIKPADYVKNSRIELTVGKMDRCDTTLRVLNFVLVSCTNVSYGPIWALHSFGARV